MPPRPQPPAPLAGVRVLELTQGIAGPVCGKYLAAHGAEVVRVESRRRPDVIRLYGSRAIPADTAPELAMETAPHWSNYNAGKLSLGLDVANPTGRDLLLRLVAASDVFVTNLAVGVCDRLGLAPEDLAARNPRLVYCALTSFGGGAGDYRDFRIWGPNLSALTGMDSLTAQPGREPCGLNWISYSDYLAGAHAAAAVLALLSIVDDQSAAAPPPVDISQAEVSLGALGPELLRTATGGSGTAPVAGIFPTRDDDRWVAVECDDDAQWRRLLGVAAGSGLATDPRWQAVDVPPGDRPARDAAIAAWTSGFDRDDLCERLARGNVTAAPVHDQADWLTDPQLAHRRAWLIHDDPAFGVGVALGYPPKLSANPAVLSRGGPLLGEDNDYLLSEVLGLDAPARAALVAAGVVHQPSPPSAPFVRPAYTLARHLLRDATWSREPAAPPRPRPPYRPDQRRRSRPVTQLTVVDATDGLGLPAARLYRDLGADVVRVADGNADTDAAAYAFHAGHRTCDEAEARRLARTADIVLVSGQASDVTAAGWLDLAAAPGGPVVVAVTPYGLTGPRATWRGSELTAWASGGLAFVIGDPQDAPVVPAGRLLCFLAGEFAVIAGLAAVRAHGPERTGPGEVVDIALQEVAVSISGEVDLCGLLDDGRMRRRVGNRRTSTAPLGMYPAADGLVSVVVLMPPHWLALRDWILAVTGDREVLDPALEGGPNRRGGAARQRVDAIVERFTRQLPKQQLFAEGQRRGIPITPVNDLTDVLADPALYAAGFLRDYDVAGVSGRAPGPLFPPDLFPPDLFPPHLSPTQPSTAARPAPAPSPDRS